MSDQPGAIWMKISSIVLAALRQADRREPYIEDTKIQVGDFEAVRPFFAAALKDRFPWYLLTIGATLGASYLLIPGSGPRFFQVWGLLLDLTGAVILGIGLLRSDIGIERDSIPTTVSTTATWGSYNSGKYSEEYRDLLSVSSEARDTSDALAGVILLIIGFALQIIPIVI